jgi:nucleotide-binding universal stress UspA family protein
MAQSPVIVGVDPTPAGALAATVGCAVAGAMEAPCHLVHVVREPAGLSRGKAESTERADTLDRFLDATRSALERSLAPHLTASALEHLDVHIGNPAWVLGQVARDDGARLLVLGGKHHSAAVRWFGGSTAHHAVRTIDVPLLVAAAPKTRFDRVLVACDLSDASAPTLEAARAFGRPFGALLRMLTVVEPLPAIPDVGIQIDEGERLRVTEQEAAALVAGGGNEDRVESIVQTGSAARTIADEVARWDADIVVVGSHGKGWVDRVLLGSTTERLLNRLPCSILVIPIRGPGIGT